LCAEEPLSEPRTGYCIVSTTQLTVQRSVRLISDSENTRRPELHSWPLSAVATAEHEDLLHPIVAFEAVNKCLALYVKINVKVEGATPIC